MGTNDDWRSKTPAQLVTELVERYGSDDKLATALREADRPGASRQRTIEWRHGKGISRAYAEALAQLAELPVEAFLLASPTRLAARLETLVAQGEQLLVELPAVLDAVKRHQGEV